MKRGAVRLILALAVLAGAGCTDTKEVFVAFPLFDAPPAGAANFLGYSNQEANLPVCGNCHVGQNSEWQQTAHATTAWSGLQDSGHAQGFCESCHAVSENGNAVEDATAGWPGTLDPRYQNVQCESCHGPGLAHVTNPDAGQPLASIVVGTDLTNGCGECHQGSHHGFVDEWAESRHGILNSYPAGREACASCHEGKAALAAFGVKANYIEKGSDELLPITCAVCHDPHDATNEHQLRFPIDVPNVENNLCMKCHHKRAEPDPTSSRGPHSPQGPLLLGEAAGWIPPNFQYADLSIRSTHGGEKNPKLCATCHVNDYTVTDAATGDFTWSVKGHSFKAIPCLDEAGVPTASEDCDLSERTFASCATSGCHGDQVAARAAFILGTTRIADLVAELNDLLDLVPSTEFSTSDDTYTVAEGAKFNAGLGAIESSAIHNPFLTEALLTASIREVKSEYGLAAMSTVSLENVFDQN